MSDRRSSPDTGPRFEAMAAEVPGIWNARLRRQRLAGAVLLIVIVTAYNVRNVVRGVYAFLLVWACRPTEREVLQVPTTTYFREVFGIFGYELLGDYLQATRLPTPRLTVRFYARMFDRTSADSRIVSSPRVRGLQGKIMERILSGRLGIRPDRRELEILSWFARGSVLLGGLLRAAGSGHVHRIDDETRFRCTVVFGAFVQGLRVYLSRCLASGSWRSALTFEQVYPADLDQRRTGAATEMLRDRRQNASVRLRVIRAGRNLGAYLAAVGMLTSGSGQGLEPVRRTLHRLERIYFG